MSTRYLVALLTADQLSKRDGRDVDVEVGVSAVGAGNPMEKDRGVVHTEGWFEMSIRRTRQV